MSMENDEHRARVWLRSHTARDDYRHSLVAEFAEVRAEQTAYIVARLREIAGHMSGGVQPWQDWPDAARGVYGAATYIEEECKLWPPR